LRVVGRLFGCVRCVVVLLCCWVRVLGLC
jgi:hypothetical protein